MTGKPLATGVAQCTRHIADAQEEPEILALLTAQRHKYLIAKRWLAFGFCLDFGYAVLMGCATCFNGEWLPALATLVGFSIDWVNDFVLRKVSTARSLAATVQQWIDCQLFARCSGWNFGIAVCLPENDRLELVAAYHDWNHERERRWYADYSALDPQEEIYRCQMENISWNARIRQRYIWLLTVILTLPTLSAVIAVFVCGITCAKIVLLAAWFIPIAKLSKKYWDKMGEDRKRFNKLNETARAVDLNAQGIYTNLLDLQKLIFEYRKQSLLVPEFVFRFRRRKDQDIEDKKAAFASRKEDDRA